MGSLFLVELGSFLAKTTQSTIVVDFNRDQQVQSLFIFAICCVCVCIELVGRELLCAPPKPTINTYQ